MHCSLCLSCISLLDKVFSVVVLDRLFFIWETKKVVAGQAKQVVVLYSNDCTAITLGGLSIGRLRWVLTYSQGPKGWWGAGGWGVDLAFDDTKVWSYHLIRIPAVIKETSFLKSASWSNSQSRCWKIAKYWYCSTKFGTILNHMEWLHYTDLMMKISV